MSSMKSTRAQLRNASKAFLPYLVCLSRQWELELAKQRRSREPAAHKVGWARNQMSSDTTIVGVPVPSVDPV
jgi:hypothetical protein